MILCILINITAFLHSFLPSCITSASAQISFSPSRCVAPRLDRLFPDSITSVLPRVKAFGGAQA